MSSLRRLTGHDLDLGNSVGVTEDDTNLRGSRALLYTRTQSESIPFHNRQDISTDLGEADDGLLNRLGGGLEP